MSTLVLVCCCHSLLLLPLPLSLPPAFAERQDSGSR
jgi:hypothetical protein